MLGAMTRPHHHLHGPEDEPAARDLDLGVEDADDLAEEALLDEAAMLDELADEALEAEELEYEELADEFEGEPDEDAEVAEVALAEEEAGAEEEPLAEVDHEADLGEILARQFGLEAAEEDEEEAAPVAPPTGEEDEGLVAPRRADEFVCRNCFLVKSHWQLADPARGLCEDCV